MRKEHNDIVKTLIPDLLKEIGGGKFDSSDLKTTIDIKVIEKIFNLVGWDKDRSKVKQCWKKTGKKIRIKFRTSFRFSSDPTHLLPSYVVEDYVVKKTIFGKKYFEFDEQIEDKEVLEYMFWTTGDIEPRRSLHGSIIYVIKFYPDSSELHGWDQNGRSFQVKESYQYVEFFKRILNYVEHKKEEYKTKKSYDKCFTKVEELIRNFNGETK
jgi:hypothetical protein